jgi:hypothetical protein
VSKAALVVQVVVVGDKSQRRIGAEDEESLSAGLGPLICKDLDLVDSTLLVNAVFLVSILTPWSQLFEDGQQ